MTTKPTPEKIPVSTDSDQPKRKRGAVDPIEAIPYPEVRAFMRIEQAFDGLDEPARRRLANLVADKFGAPKALVIPATDA